MNNTFSKHAKLSLRLLASCALLISGLVVYWLYRPEIALFQLLHIQNPDFLATTSSFELILKNHFADAAWCLAIVLVITVMRDCRLPRGYRQLLAILPFFSEAMQASGVIPGVFDWVDMAIYLCIMIPTLSKEFRPMSKIQKNIAGSFALAFFTFALIATSSSREPPNYVTGIFTLPEIENDLFTKTDLVKSLGIEGSPSIVLRVPNTGGKVSKEHKQRAGLLYNLIEKEFARAGFMVRDRQLFEKVLEQETSDYSKIGSITETDFILELLRYDLERKLSTSSYVGEDGEPAIAPYKVSFNGAVAEYKLISLRKNDLAGSYTFYYSPCTDGCSERIDINARRWSVKNSIPVNFFESTAREMVKEMGWLR